MPSPIQPSQAHLPVSGGMLRGFVRMPIAEKLLLAAAWIVIGLFAAALHIVPFRRLARMLGEPIGAVGCIPLADQKQVKRARLVRRAILRAARIAPFRADCLPQALTAAVLCRLLGVPISIHLGVRREDDLNGFAAHAWTCVGPEAVTGGHSFSAYTPVTCFLPARLAGRA
jgi:hypothetical protein